jgi:hypothetical protein
LTRDGKAYERISIKVERFGDKWISGFGNDENKNWIDGDTVDIQIEEVGQYLNFRMPQKKDDKRELYELRDIVADLQDKVKKLSERVVVLECKESPMIIPEDQLFPDDKVPF